MLQFFCTDFTQCSLQALFDDLDDGDAALVVFKCTSLRAVALRGGNPLSSANAILPELNLF